MKENNTFNNLNNENDTMERNPRINTSHNKNTSEKIGLCILMILPFVLICVGISLFSVYFFKEYVASSSFWRFIVNTNAIASPSNTEGEEHISGGEIIGGVIEEISIKPVEKPETSEEMSEEISGETSEETSEEETSQEEIVEQIYYNRDDFPGYKWGELWATLSIPAINLDSKNVYVGESKSIYKKGIGKRYGTRFPGQGGNIVLGAHVTREFYDLQLIKVGDRVYIETEYGSYVYEVYETVIFSPDEYKYVMNYDDGEKLTLYACYPREAAHRTERFGAICKKISGPEWIEIE